MPVVLNTASVVIAGPREVVVQAGTTHQFAATIFRGNVATAEVPIWELRFAPPHIFDAAGNYYDHTYEADGSYGDVGSIDANGLYTAPASVAFDEFSMRHQSPTLNRAILVYALSPDPDDAILHGSPCRTYHNVFVTYRP